ncbi:MAG: porin family protein [Flavisolibacter sp.]
MKLKFQLTVLVIHAFLISNAQVRLAAYAGPQLTSAHYTVNENKQPTSWKFGVMAGVSAKVPFDNQLYFFPSIYYSLKGYKVTLNDPAFPPTKFAKNNNTTLHTVAIAPLFHIDLTKNISHPFVRFGPSVDFALSGREKFDTVSRNGATGPVDRPMLFSFGDYGRITAQLNIHLGYEIESGLMVFGFYEHGIGSLNNADGGPRILHRIAGVSVGWFFASKH